MQIIGDIPDLTGRVCEAMLCQQFWHQGELAGRVNVLFLKVRDKNWHRFFFDCGVLFWREVDQPDVWKTTAADEFHYPHVDIGVSSDLVGRVIESITPLDNGTAVEIYVRFSGGVVLRLRDEDDRMSLSVVSATEC